MSRWRSAARVAGHALAFVTIALCMLLPTSRYDWVSDVDPTIRPADLSGGDDSVVVIGTLTVLTLLIEVLAVTTGRSRRERFVPALLIVTLATAWLARAAS